MFDLIAKGIENPSFLSIFFAYMGGVLASLTPCIYPMIPILLGIIVASEMEKKGKGFPLSLSYSLGLSIVYAALGMLAAMTGGFFGSVATNPWSYLIFGNLCILLSFWMMDWISIPLFSSGGGINRKGYVGAFITGGLSGLVAAPCTSPVLAGLLVYVSSTKDILLGGAMMFAFSIGMSTLLIVLGTFSGRLKSLPRPGLWMVWVKKGLGAALFLFGEYFLLKAGRLLL